MSRRFSNYDGDDSISVYFKDVRKSVILTPKEEVILAKKIKEGDKKAIEKLVNANLKFVISVAKEYQGQGLSLADLISEGNYGLIKAANKFDHTKGFRFISYAVWWIKQSILQSLNDNARMVRLPTNVINKISKLKKEIEKFELANEREPVYGDIVKDNDEKVELLSFQRCTSLNEPINEEGDELIELIQNNDNHDEQMLIDERVKNEIHKVLLVLDDRERNIVECYFGINIDSEPMTLESIGEKYSLTKERIRQIKRKALMKLRANSYDLFNLIKE
jgi:RNA polymerase primary sigma factor